VVVLPQCGIEFVEGFGSFARADRRRLAGDVGHQRIYVFKLRQRRPAFVSSPPLRARLEPHCEGLGEVLGRVALGVPLIEVQHEAPVERARRAAEGRIGRLTVAYMDFAINGPLPAIMRRFRKSSPEIEVNLIHLWTARQREALIGGEIDLGFLIGKFSAPDIESLLVRREGLVAVLPEHHALTKRKKISLKDLRDEPFVMGSREFWGPYRDQIDVLCQGAGFTPNVVQEAYNSDGIFGLVAAGLGVTLYTESARHLRPRGAVVRPLSPSTRIDTFAAWRTDTRSPARDAFVRAIAARDDRGQAR